MFVRFGNSCRIHRDFNRWIELVTLSIFLCATFLFLFWEDILFLDLSLLSSYEILLSFCIVLTYYKPVHSIFVGYFKFFFVNKLYYIERNFADMLSENSLGLNTVKNPWPNLNNWMTKMSNFIYKKKITNWVYNICL